MGPRQANLVLSAYASSEGSGEPAHPAVSPEPSLLAHTSSESRGTFRQKARSIAPLKGWACAVKVCHDGMLEDTNSLGAAQWRINSVMQFNSLKILGHNWAASSEFVSSSIPSWQIVTAHAQPIRGVRDLAFCLKVPLDPLLVWASSGGSGETARMRRLAWTFAARIGDKYQIRLTRPNCIDELNEFVWRGDDLDYQENFLKPELIKFLTRLYSTQFEENDPAKLTLRDKIIECARLATEVKMFLKLILRQWPQIVLQRILEMSPISDIQNKWAVTQQTNKVSVCP